MLKRLLSYKWYLMVIMILIIAEPSITSWLYLFLQRLYNRVTIGTLRGEIIGAILIGVVAWLGKRMLLFSVSVVKSRFICDIRQDLKHDIFMKIIGLNTANLSQIAESSEYISILTNDLTIIEQRFFSNIIGLLSQIFSMIILGSTFFTMNWKLAGFVFAFGIMALFVPVLFENNLNRENLLYSNSLSKFTQKSKEFFGAYSTIKNYSVEETVCKKFDLYNAKVEESKFSYDCSISLADSVGSMLTWFARIIVIGVGLVMLSKGEILLGTIVAAQGFVEEIASPMQGIVENINSIKSVKSVSHKIETITNEPGEGVKIMEESELSNPSIVEISFHHLTIPSGDTCIVKDFSFNFRPGGKYLIIGKNGSGKSSVFKALKKCFYNYTGEILINNRDIRTISNLNLSQLVSYLNENVAIFSGSLSDNITFWNFFPSGDLGRVLQKAHLGLDPNRHIGEGGVDISSGEQRRIEIARSTISPAKVLIFDEVISTLDIETAFEIEKSALEYPDKTVIFISHNFSGKLITKYDEILVMKDGCLVAHGTYDTLMKTCDYFKHICTIKFG